MVNFREKIGGKAAAKPVDPIKLYDMLDRAHDKGPLRPAQIAVLNAWNDKFKSNRDTVIKLHTGQGKTLIGLLLLQSHLNASEGPVVYLCPNKHLCEQTCSQAKQFGIATTQAEDDLPEDFIDSQKILVTTVQKLFNGKSKFGLHRESVSVGALLMDDAHACSDIIRQSCRIRIERKEPVYVELLALFSSSIQQQGAGTFADLNNGDRNAILPVPYWSWMQHENDVAEILAKYTNSKSIAFTWPLLKDMLKYCQCIFSGAAVEIEPYIPPLSAFGSYSSAAKRYFMSATVTDDSFLIKGLQLSPDAITNPLTYDAEKWSGEKMILMPSLIDSSLDRSKIVQSLAPPRDNRKYGVVALTIGFDWSRDWESYGALVAKTETLGKIINDLYNRNYGKTVVLANRYDGIDLPDDSCRILIFDSKPFSENLSDRYEEQCRATSAMTIMRTFRTIEQGMGRSVRGEKDYSVIIVIGTELVRILRDKNSRKYLSAQMDMQIKIGLDIARYAKQDIPKGIKPEQALSELIAQSLSRDDGWKEYYIEKMDYIAKEDRDSRVLACFSCELKAEQLFMNRDYSSAAKCLQNLLDSNELAKIDKAWYLQNMGRFYYEANRPESERLQNAAFKIDRFLLKPSEGVSVSKLTMINVPRVDRIIEWIKSFENYQDLNIRLSDILENLNFGVMADKFERALNELSEVLGFVGERPDKEWKEGPDNLWALNDIQYILWECKNEVTLDRSEINKGESAQMNSSCAWFERHYPGALCKNIIVHPTNKISSSAAFTHNIEAMRDKELHEFIVSIRNFYKSFESQSFDELSPTNVQSLLNAHNLSIDYILNNYTKTIRQLPKA